MKKIYLVLKINNKGNVVGKIQVFSSKEKAEEVKNYNNVIFKTWNYIVEEHNIN